MSYFEIFQHLKTSRVRWQMVWVSAQNILDFPCKHVDSMTCSAQIHTACSGFHAPWDPKNHTDQRRSSAIFKSLRHRRMIKTFCQWKHVPRNIIQLICTVPAHSFAVVYTIVSSHVFSPVKAASVNDRVNSALIPGHVNKCQGRHSTLEGANLILAWSVCVKTAISEFFSSSRSYIHLKSQISGKFAFQSIKIEEKFQFLCLTFGQVSVSPFMV